MGLRLPRWRLPCLCALAELNGMGSNTAKVRAAADAMVKSGLAAHGFQYINIDDCWEAGRDAEGDGRVEMGGQLAPHDGPDGRCALHHYQIDRRAAGAHPVGERTL